VNHHTLPNFQQHVLCLAKLFFSNKEGSSDISRSILEGWLKEVLQTREMVNDRKRNLRSSERNKG
jgi:hypothetical protein